MLRCVSKWGEGRGAQGLLQAERADGQVCRQPCKALELSVGVWVGRVSGRAGRPGASGALLSWPGWLLGATGRGSPSFRRMGGPWGGSKSSRAAPTPRRSTLLCPPGPTPPPCLAAITLGDCFMGWRVQGSQLRSHRKGGLHWLRMWSSQLPSRGCGGAGHGGGHAGGRLGVSPPRGGAHSVGCRGSCTSPDPELALALQPSPSDLASRLPKGGARGRWP